jgi:putative acetyltransferase
VREGGLRREDARQPWFNSRVANSVTIRDERPSDREGVRAVVTAAFGQSAEADLVEALHAAQAALVSLVAVVDDTDDAVVGHIMFSPMSHEGTRAPGRGHEGTKVRDQGHEDTTATSYRLAGLAPMAVAPTFQRSGIGSQLIREGLRRCAALGLDGVVVLGHADYYPRFGFSRADAFGLRCEYDVAPENFMALALPGRALPPGGGLLHYHPAFAAL